MFSNGTLHESDLPRVSLQRSHLLPYRAVDGNRLDKSLTEAISSALDRAEAVAGLGAAKSKADRRLLSDVWDLHWSALISARNALQGKPYRLRGIIQTLIGTAAKVGITVFLSWVSLHILPAISLLRSLPVCNRQGCRVSLHKCHCLGVSASFSHDRALC